MDFMDRTYRWIRDFISQPHPELKRSGEICPFTKPAIKQQKLFFQWDDFTGNDTEVLKKILLDYKDQYTSADAEADHPLRSLVIVFPHLKMADYEALKMARILVKKPFLQAGITLGEFYPTNNDGSIRNEQFYIAQSPFAMIVIRQLARHDKLFLSKHPELYSLYQSKFKNDSTSKF